MSSFWNVNSYSITIIVRCHGDGDTGVREETECVTRSFIQLKRVALEVNAKQIHWAQPQQVPHNMVPVTQHKLRKVSIHEAIHR